MSALSLLLGWPDGQNGQVWPNVAADVVALPVAFLWSHRRQARRFAEHLRQELAQRDQADEARHAEHAQAISEVAGLVSELHGKVDSAVRPDGRPSL